MLNAQAKSRPAALNVEALCVERAIAALMRRPSQTRTRARWLTLYPMSRRGAPALKSPARRRTRVPLKARAPAGPYARHGLSNPLKYTDPSGHWTEDELSNSLGQNWQQDYFGTDAVFEGRDQLLAFLTSNNTTDPLILGLVKGMIEGARTLHAAGFSFDGIDAIGMRVSGGGGLILGGGGSADIVLNTRAGQFSAFISGQAGAVFGETALATGGIVLIANLPTNDGLRDAFEQVGIYGGDIVGIDVDVSWSAPMADSYDPRDKANAGSIGAGGAVPGIAVYGMIGYSWEALRVDVSGMHWAPHRPSIQDVVNSVTDAFVHDVVKSPIWQQPR